MMVKWLGSAGKVVLLAVVTLGVGGAMAATSSGVDILSDDAARGPTDTIDLGAVRPIAKSVQPATKPVPRGNPLWAVPLSALSATQERPIFSATRRPPPRAVAAMPAVETSAPPPPKPAEAPLSLVLVGAVVGEGDAIAILLDRADQKIVRMRQGESRAGWSLSAVQPREVTFKHGDRQEVLALQRRDVAPAAPGAPAAPPGTAGRLAMPAAGDTSFAPFVPRSVPKNGESDGL